MKSITQTPGHVASTRKPNRTSNPSSEQESDQIRGFHYDPRRAALGYDYLRRKWLPREGPLFYAFIQVMRGHCYYNPQTGEVRDQCYPKVETIAKECGVDPATIHRLIQRDKTTGEFISKHAEALKRFIKVLPRWRYDERVGHKVQRSSIYLVALDDPPVPEEDHLVAEKETELATLLTIEQVQRQRQVASVSLDADAGTDLQNASQLTLAKCESVMSRILRDKSLPLTLTANTYLNRTIGERPIGNQKNEKKALVGGEPAGSPSSKPASTPTRTTRPRGSATSGKQAKKQETTPRDQALASAREAAGAVAEELLRDLGGSNPAGGAQTILEALVDVNTPVELIRDLIAVGTKRLKQQQELTHIFNPTGYLIGIMHNLAVEAWLKGWNVEQIQAEDEAKHAQALRSAAHAGNRLLTDESDAAPQEEEALAPGADADADSSAAPEPTYYLPEGVEVADAATVATWQDHLPDPEANQPRRVSMLWGFVRDAIRDRLNVARRSQLEGLTPKWDATRPRTLLLVCDLTYTARAVECHLRREIEPQIGKLLSHFFDEFQVVYAPVREEPHE